MKKAILVVDLPNDIFIDDCTIEYRVVEHVMEMCVANGVKRLKPMPYRYVEDKVKIETTRDAEVCTHGIQIGRNMVINEILGEEDE